MINKKKIFLKFGWSLYGKKYKLCETSKCRFSNSECKPPWKIIFFGTDKFSLFSLESLLKEYRKGQLIKRLEVCTSIKKGKNVVHAFAEKENLKIWKWPPQLPQCEFDAGIVVSFGHLIPKTIIDKFPLGMINVHASLLPRWRGAAPIIYSLANGDEISGVSIMQIEPSKFDVGKIISQKSYAIPADMFMPELHSELGSLGASELIECLKDLPHKLRNAMPQSEKAISYAPKVEPSFARIDWRNMTSIEIFNLERALRGFLPLTSTWNGEIIKLFNIRKLEGNFNLEIKEGFIIYDDKLEILKVACSDKRFVTVEKVQIYQKKTMSAKDFNNGYLKKKSVDERFFF